MNTSLESFSQSTVEITKENNQTEVITTGFELLSAIVEAQKEEQKKGKLNTKEIGDEGEFIVYSLEKQEVGKMRTN